MTLAVQAINFLCAYVIMRYGLFGHAIASARMDKEYNDSLLSAIADRKVIIEQKLFEKQEHWKACQYQLAKQEPSARPAQEQGLILTDTAIQVPDLSADAVRQAIKQSVSEIKKIGDVT